MSPSEIQVPKHWMRGQLLNVRPVDGGYVATLIYDEEYHPRKNNGVHFASLWECQEFVSWWYSRSSEPVAVEAVDEIVPEPAKPSRRKPVSH